MSISTSNAINEFNIVLNAYTEAIKNNIINLQDKYLSPNVTRNASDFSTISGITFADGTPLNDPIAAANNNACVNACSANSSCVGAAYKNESCQMYSVLPQTNNNYSYDASSSLILYNRSSSDTVDRTNAINSNVTAALQTRLNSLLDTLTRDLSGNNMNAEWNAAISNLNTANVALINDEEQKKNNQELDTQLYNSGLNIIQTKTKYILFIVALLILSAIYVRDFKFSIFIFIVLFLTISVYGSIFLGAFLLLVIVLYLVYYAY